MSGIGVLPRTEMQARSLAIARGEYTPSADEPKVWLTSADARVSRGFLASLTQEQRVALRGLSDAAINGSS